MLMIGRQDVHSAGEKLALVIIHEGVLYEYLCGPAA